MIVAVVCIASSARWPHSAAAQESHSGANAATMAFSAVRFTAAAPYASDAELKRRLGVRNAPRGYAIENEKFRLGLPTGYSTNDLAGLFVWISPGEDPKIPKGWEPELARRNLLFVSPLNAGNERNAIDRCRLALDAVCNLCRQHRVDPARIFVAGFSGGGRIASILGVCWADLFAGCLPICGVDFYENVPTPSGEFYPPTYRPNREIVARAREHGRFVLLTGELDPNRDNTKYTFEQGFRARGFRHTRYVEVSGMRHALPSAAVLASALDFVDAKRAAQTNSAPASHSREQRP